MDIADAYGHNDLLTLLSSQWNVDYHSTFSIQFRQSAASAAIVCFSEYASSTFYLPFNLLEQLLGALSQIHYEHRGGEIDEKRQQQGATAVRSTSKQSDRCEALPGLGFAFRRTRSLSVDLSVRIDGGLPVAESTDTILLISEQQDEPPAKLERRVVSDPSPRKQSGDAMWPGTLGGGRPGSPDDEPVTPEDLRDLATMFADASPT